MSDLSAIFARLAETIYAPDGMDAVHRAVVDSATDLVAGCDRACLMLARNGGFETVAASDDIARHMDRLEAELGEGPCVDAILEEAYQYDADIADGSPWPRLAERLRSETPVRGMIGYRLVIDGAKTGALNLFSDRPGALTVESADQGAVLASFASVALTSAKTRAEVDNLRRGLESNREIGKAVGLLMAAHHVDQDRAFDILRRTSQELNQKVTDIAAEIVSGQDRQFRRDAPDGGPDPHPT